MASGRFVGQCPDAGFGQPKYCNNAYIHVVLTNLCSIFSILKVSGWPYISLKTLTFSNGCIFLNIGSIYTKLGDFVKLGLHL